jgi:hypothetical protein
MFREEMLAIYEPVMEGIVQLLKSQLDKTIRARHEPDKVVLCGGLADSIPLRSRLESHIQKVRDTRGLTSLELIVATR